jgi:hypothetical protein
MRRGRVSGQSELPDQPPTWLRVVQPNRQVDVGERPGLRSRL